VDSLDRQKLATYIIAVVIFANTYLITIPESPRWLIIVIGFVGGAALIAREQASQQNTKVALEGKKDGQ
jgi:chromate transport protein ChrA